MNMLAMIRKGIKTFFDAVGLMMIILLVKSFPRFVPAGAVIRKGRPLGYIHMRKGFVGSISPCPAYGNIVRARVTYKCLNQKDVIRILRVGMKSINT